MHTLDIGDHYLLYPSVHRANGADDSRPSGAYAKKARDYEIREVGANGRRVPFDAKDAVADTDDEMQGATTYLSVLCKVLLSERGTEVGVKEAIREMQKANFMEQLQPFFSSNHMMRLMRYIASLAPPCTNTDELPTRADKAHFTRGFYEMSAQGPISDEAAHNIQEALKAYARHMTVFVVRTQDTVKLQFRKLEKEEAHNACKRNARYTHFTLKIDGLSSQDAVSRIATLLQVPISDFQFAEEKGDKHRIYQRVSAHGIDWDRIQSACMRLKNLTPASPCMSRNPLALGSFNGNYYSIFLKERKDKDEHWEKVFKPVKRSGFINYYGPERFGPIEHPAHALGLHIIRREYVLALQLFFQRTLAKTEAFRESAAAFDIANLTANTVLSYQKAAKLCPQELSNALKVLHALAKSPKNYAEAWECIDAETRSSYIRAVQSYLWNLMASRRFAMHGNALAVGDLVYKSTFGRLKKNVYGEMSPSTKVEVITEANMSEYTMLDVVLPLLGDAPDLQYPRHACGQGAYLDILQSIGAEDFMRFALPGGYRKLMVKPRRFEGSGRLFIFQLPKGCYPSSLIREFVRL